MAKSDESIKRDVVNQLTWDSRVDASDMVVKVDAGTVSLSGSVPSYYARTSAEEIAEKVVGVITVDNNLDVAFPPAFERPTDSELQNSVEKVLIWNSDINESKIDVAVENGIVDIKGTVPSFWQKVMAEQVVKSVKGVIDIRSKLAVVPTDKVADEVVAERVVERIEKNSVANPEEVDVKVRNGEVTLSGQVPSWAVWNSVYDAAKFTFGVTDINDELVISY